MYIVQSLNFSSEYFNPLILMVSYVPKQFVDDMGLKVDFPQFNSYAYKFLHLRLVVKQLTLEHSMKIEKICKETNWRTFKTVIDQPMIFQQKCKKYLFLSQCAKKNCDNIISKKSKVDIETGNSDSSQMFFSLFLQNWVHYASRSFLAAYRKFPISCY